MPLKISNEFQQLIPQLQKGCQALSVSLSEKQQRQLMYYLQQLLFWNKSYNLTAIREPKSALIKHIFDCLSIIPHLPTGSLLDVGTGAGLPAVIIAICQPDRAITALDSNQKKIRFIKQIASELSLPNLTPIASRIEDHPHKYDVITARAFASLLDFVKLCESKCKPHGKIFAMKGILPTDDMILLNKDWQIHDIELIVPELMEHRHLVILQK